MGLSGQAAAYSLAFAEMKNVVEIGKSNQQGDMPPTG